jgi:hypothetical protein
MNKSHSEEKRRLMSVVSTFRALNPIKLSRFKKVVYEILVIRFPVLFLIIMPVYISFKLKLTDFSR